MSCSSPGSHDCGVRLVLMFLLVLVGSCWFMCFQCLLSVCPHCCVCCWMFVDSVYGPSHVCFCLFNSVCFQLLSGGHSYTICLCVVAQIVKWVSYCDDCSINLSAHTVFLRAAHCSLSRMRAVLVRSLNSSSLRRPDPFVVALFKTIYGARFWASLGRVQLLLLVKRWINMVQGAKRLYLDS